MKAKAEKDALRWIYTAKGQQYFKARGDHSRKAGETAMHGTEPLEWGTLAIRWLAKGYIREAPADDR